MPPSNYECNSFSNISKLCQTKKTKRSLVHASRTPVIILTKSAASPEALWFSTKVKLIAITLNTS